MRDTERKGTIKNTREILLAFVTAESTLGVTVIGGLLASGVQERAGTDEEEKKEREHRKI